MVNELKRLILMWMISRALVICELIIEVIISTHIVWCLNFKNSRANWLIVEYAITFLISCWNKPIKELNIVVIAPIHKHSNNTVLLYSIIGELRINRYTPAVTIVAAWINAETGVGKNVYFHYIYLIIYVY